MSNNYCNECGKSHPWGSCQTTPTTTGLTNNLVTLSPELKEEIFANADVYIDQMHGHKGDDTYVAYVDGATAYALKCEQAKALLEKFISRHEAGLLPDRHIYTEIKTFLDGSK